jgi:hypothetical protein
MSLENENVEIVPAAFSAIGDRDHGQVAPRERMPR